MKPCVTTIARNARTLFPKMANAENTDETATIRAGTGVKLKTGAGLVRLFRAINRQTTPPRTEKLRRYSRSMKCDSRPFPPETPQRISAR